MAQGCAAHIAEEERDLGEFLDDPETYLGCNQCPINTDRGFVNGTFVTRDNLLSSNIPLINVLALSVKPLVMHTHANVLQGLTPEEQFMVAEAHNMLWSDAVEEHKRDAIEKKRAAAKRAGRN